MIIKVISVVEGLTGLVDARHLEALIKTGKITAFKRAHGWVRIGEDPIRKDSHDFPGPDRRKTDQQSR